jgi:hypothetical protein
MAQQGDCPRGRGLGYTQAAGFGPQGQNPRMRPPVTPPQFQRDSPPRQDGTRADQPQYATRQDPQPAFTPGYRQDPQPPVASTRHPGRRGSSSTRLSSGTPRARRAARPGRHGTRG